MTPTVLVPFPGGVQVEFIYSLGGKLATNRIWLYNINEDTDQALLDELVPLVTDFWNAGLMPYLSNELTLEQVRCTSWDDPYNYLSAATIPLTVGGIISPSHSANVAVKVTLQPPINRRIRPGANFVPGIPISEVDVNTYSPELAFRLFEHYAALIDAARTWGATEPWYWVVVSLVEDYAPRPSMLFYRCIGPILLSPYVTQQRHRLRV